MNKDALLSLIELHLPAAQAGDHEAFGHIVTGCQGGITAIALAIVRDIQASEDIAQEAFLSAWQHLKRLRNPSSFLPWLRQITRNLARDHLRRRVTERRYDGDMDDILRVVADPSPDHPERMARQHEEEVVAELIDELPEETREILLIYYREGQSSKQVADLLGMRDAAVRKRLQRARDSLRSEMLGRLGEFARTTAPSAAFTALVLAGLSVSPSAAAAGFAMGGAAASKGLSKFLFGAGAAGKGASKLLFGAAGGILFALIAGLAGVLFGVRRYWITSTDGEEKRKLAWFAVAGCGVVVLFTGLMGWSVHVESMVFATGSFFALIVSVGLMNLYWLPHILERRHLEESARNAIAARMARAEERRHAWMGMILGLVFGGLGLGFAFWMFGQV
ncbi:MAG: RNA polymerase sigma factor [Xanthomonadales bacterium]|nr:RNA polymerase sigma factor [Xanthomonadales bacterium]